MRYALGLGPVGPWGDPRTIADLARLADPWVTLAAIAMATEQVTIGTMIIPVPGRRVWSWPPRRSRSTTSPAAG